MKKNNFTQTTIMPIIKSCGHGYRIVDKDTIILEMKPNIYNKLEINRKDDSVSIDGIVYKANQDKDKFNIFPKEENIKKYGTDWNPLCNVFHLFKQIEKQNGSI